MPVFHLISADAALRAVLAEQLALTGMGEVREQADLIEALKTDETGLILLDESAATQKALKILPEDRKEKKKRILFLGEVKNDFDAGLILESFPKPIRLGHFLSRLQFHQKSAARPRPSFFIFGPYRLEPQNRQMIVEATGAVIRLTEKETALLDYLGQSDQPVAREELLAALWGYDGRIDTHTLETHIYQLRRKLNPSGEGPHLLLNEQGAYRLKR